MAENSCKNQRHNQENGPVDVSIDASDLSNLRVFADPDRITELEYRRHSHLPDNGKMDNIIAAVTSGCAADEADVAMLRLSGGLSFWFPVSVQAGVYQE